MGDTPDRNAGDARRLNIGGMPTPPTALLSIACVIVIAVAYASLVTIRVMRGALLRGGYANGWVTPLAIALAILSVLIALPLIRAGRRWLQVRGAVASGDIVTARVTRSEARALGFIAIGYASAQAILVLVAQFLLANHEAVAKTFFFAPLIVETFPLVAKAFWINIELFAVTEVLVLIWGLAVALAMLAPGPAGRPLRLIASAYVDIFRAIPAVLVIYLVGFGVPLTGVPFLKDFSLMTFVVVALTLTVGAYVAEIYRAGIQGIHWSQGAAARSLGLTYIQSLRFVIVPQAVRQIVPPLLNAFIALQKDTALVSVIGVVDSFNQSMLIAANHFNLSAVTTVALLFIAITIPQSRLVERMVRRDRARMRA